MAHISWQGCPKEGTPGQISPVRESLKTFIPPPPSITHIAFVVASAAFNCWFLFARPGSSHLSKVAGCAERLPGHWDFNNDLREVSTQDLLTLWRIGLKHKGQSWQWEAVNREIFIKVLTPPLRREGSLTGTANMEATFLMWRAIFCAAGCCPVVYWSQHSPLRAAGY